LNGEQYRKRTINVPNHAQCGNGLHATVEQSNGLFCTFGESCIEWNGSDGGTVFVKVRYDICAYHGKVTCRHMVDEGILVVE
jgi:hypothetical protein